MKLCSVFEKPLNCSFKCDAVYFVIQPVSTYNIFILRIKPCSVAILWKATEFSFQAEESLFFSLKTNHSTTIVFVVITVLLSSASNILQCGSNHF